MVHHVMAFEDRADEAILPLAIGHQPRHAGVGRLAVMSVTWRERMLPPRPTSENTASLPMPPMFLLSSLERCLFFS
jgi:hypothetical protein